MSTILKIIDLKLLKRQVRSKITYRPKFARNFVFQLLVGKRSTLKKLDVHLKFGFLEKANDNICSTQRLLKANVKGSFSYDYPETLNVQRQEIHPCKNVSLKLSGIFFFHFRDMQSQLSLTCLRITFGTFSGFFAHASSSCKNCLGKKTKQGTPL